MTAVEAGSMRLEGWLQRKRERERVCVYVCTCDRMQGERTKAQATERIKETKERTDRWVKK